jgi:hypothetical protein
LLSLSFSVPATRFIGLTAIDREKILHISSRLPGAISSPSATCAANPGPSMHLNSVYVLYFFSKEGLKLWIHALLPDYEFAEAGIF